MSCTKSAAPSAGMRAAASAERTGGGSCAAATPGATSAAQSQSRGRPWRRPETIMSARQLTLELAQAPLQRLDALEIRDRERHAGGVQAEVVAQAGRAPPQPDGARGEAPRRRVAALRTGA